MSHNSTSVHLRLRAVRRAGLLAGCCAAALPLIAKAQSTYTVTQTTDDGQGDVSGSLSWAIDQANANPGSTINISLGGGGSGAGAGATILLGTSLPQITAAVTINGNDYAIDGAVVSHLLRQ